MQDKSIVPLFTFASGFLIVLVFLFQWGPSDHLSEEEVLSRFHPLQSQIVTTCYKYGVDPKKYLCVVAGELLCNWDQYDLLDEMQAAAGFDPSLGFAQVRLSTALWLELNHRDLLGGGTMPAHRSELLERVLEDSSNILYSVCYLRLIRETLQTAGIDSPSIRQLGSWYAHGIDRDTLHVDPVYSNPVGIMAEKLANSGFVPQLMWSEEGPALLH